MTRKGTKTAAAASRSPRYASAVACPLSHILTVHASSWGADAKQVASRDSTPLSFDFSASTRSSTTPTPAARPAMLRGGDGTNLIEEHVFGSGAQPATGGPVSDLRGPPGRESHE